MSEVASRPTAIQGYVQLKRKMEWVQRYAQVQSGLFSYKKNKTDKAMRKNVDLRTAVIKFSTRVPGIANYNHYISLETPAKEKIFIEYSDIDEFDRWVEALKSQTQPGLQI